MLERIPPSVVAPRVHHAVAALAVLAIRFVSGAFLLGVGMGKFINQSSEVADFRHYGVPLPEVAVPLSGVIEVVGGAFVLLGFLVRPAAALVALNLVVALLTAGVTDGGSFHLVAGPLLLAAMLVLVFTGAPAPSIDARLSLRAPPSTPR